MLLFTQRPEVKLIIAEHMLVQIIC